MGWDFEDLEGHKACSPSESGLDSGGSAGLEAEVQALGGADGVCTLKMSRFLRVD